MMSRAIMNICINCTKKFEKPDKRNSGKYCCRACYVAYKSNPKNSARNKVCIYCEAKFVATRSHQSACSISCALNQQYRSGRKRDTTAANESVRKNSLPMRKGKPAAWVKSDTRGEVCAKISAAKLGEKNAMYGVTGKKHHNWRGGKNATLWKSVEYQRWRKAVYNRDNYTCVECGDSTGHNLEADHIKPRYLFPKLTFDINNGRTLCKSCHMQTPTWGARAKKLTREMF